MQSPGVPDHHMVGYSFEVGALIKVRTRPPCRGIDAEVKEVARLKRAMYKKDPTYKDFVDAEATRLETEKE